MNQEWKAFMLEFIVLRFSSVLTFQGREGGSFLLTILTKQMSGMDSAYGQAVIAFSALHQTRHAKMIHPLVLKLLAEGATPPLCNMLTLVEAIRGIEEHAIPKMNSSCLKSFHGVKDSEVRDFLEQAVFPWFYLMDDYDGNVKKIPTNVNPDVVLDCDKMNEIANSVEFHARSFPGTELEEYVMATQKRLKEITSAVLKNEAKWSVDALQNVHPAGLALYQWFWSTFAFYELEVRTRSILEVIAQKFHSTKGNTEKVPPETKYMYEQESFLKAFSLRNSPGHPFEADFMVPMDHLTQYARGVLCGMADQLASNLLQTKETCLASAPLTFRYHSSHDESGSVTLNPDGSFEAAMSDGVSNVDGTWPEYEESRLDKGTFIRQGNIITFTVKTCHYSSSGDIVGERDEDVTPPAPFTCLVDFRKGGESDMLDVPAMLLLGYPVAVTPIFCGGNGSRRSRSWLTLGDETHAPGLMSRKVFTFHPPKSKEGEIVSRMISQKGPNREKGKGKKATRQSLEQERHEDMLRNEELELLLKGEEEKGSKRKREHRGVQKE